MASTVLIFEYSLGGAACVMQCIRSESSRKVLRFRDGLFRDCLGSAKPVAARKHPWMRNLINASAQRHGLSVVMTQR